MATVISSYLTSQNARYHIPLITDGIGKKLSSTFKQSTLASLVINFLDKKLDVDSGKITFTRNDTQGSCATYFGSDGRLGVMGMNALLWSNDITQSSWQAGGSAVKNGPNSVSFTAQNDNVTQITPASTSAVGYTWTFSVMLSGSGYVKLLMQDYGGAFPSSYSTEITLTSTPTLYQLTRTHSDATATKMAVQVFNSRSASPSTVTISEAQLERNSVATTYSETTTAANSGPRMDYDPAQPLITGTTGVELVNGSWAAPIGLATATANAARIFTTGSGENSAVQTNTSVTVGKQYRVSFDITSYANGTVAFTSDGSTNQFTASALGSYSTVITATGTVIQFKRATSGLATNISLANISVQEVTYGTTGVESINAATAWITFGVSTGTSINTATSTVTFDGSAANYSGVNTNAPLVTGKTYKVTFTLSNYVSGQIQFGGSLNGTGYVGGNGVKTGLFVYGGAGPLLQVGSPSLNGTVSNISVQEVTFTPKGYMVEEGRTNLLLQSRDLTQTVWSTNSVDVTPTRNQLGIDGSANSACLITEGTLLTAQSTQQVTGLSVGATVTHSRILKRGNTDWVRMFAASPGGNGYQAWFNLATGAVGTTGVLGTGTGSATTPVSLGNGWYRCSVTATIGAADTSCNALLCSASANSSSTRVSGATYIVDYAQLEAGSFATSYIPTTTAAIARGNDNSYMNGTNFTSWYNQTQGTFVIEYDRNEISGAHILLEAKDATSVTPDRICFLINSTNDPRAQIGIGGVVGLDSNGVYTSPTVGSVAKVALGYQSGSSAVTRNGSTPFTSSATYTVGTTYARLNIGSTDNGVYGLGTTSYINGHIRSITYYNTRLPDLTLQKLTGYVPSQNQQPTLDLNFISGSYYGDFQ